jgi:Xaa-Pro aminopeptidase
MAALSDERSPFYPVDKRLVNAKLLNKEEADWLQSHNQWCKKKLQPLLGDDRRALRWLRRQ